MSWKGSLRAYRSAVNSSERAARARQRELQLNMNRLNKMEELERANYEVQIYENQIDLVLSLHKECGDSWDWEYIRTSAPPDQIIRSNKFEEQAKLALSNYKPGVIDQLFNKVNTKQEQFENAIKAAILKDDELYKKELFEFTQQIEEWKTMVDLSTRILKHELNSYSDAINLINPFSEINHLGAGLKFKCHENSVEVGFSPNDEEVIPAETKSLLKSGKLSVKETPKSRLYQMYQDYICAAVLRIARELFALLPIEIVHITALKNLLNSQTGYMENKPILSVVVPRETIERINFDLIDPSDSMDNFVHNMNFNRTKGFSAVDVITRENFVNKKD